MASLAEAMAEAIGMVRALGRIHRLATGMFPDFTWEHWRNRILMQLRTAKYAPAVKAWYETTDNPWLAAAQARYPLLGGAMYLTYIHFDWTPAERLAAIDRHYRLIDGRTAILAQCIGDSVEVARLDDEYPGLRLVLDKPAWFSREGEVALNLFVGEHRCYSVVFSLGSDAGERIIIVGALQGSSATESKDLYRDLTHALHGKRPRDLLLWALKMLAKQFGIERLWGICNAKRWQVPADYDAIWQEHHGELRDNGFFVIPAAESRRDYAALRPNKRKAYRLRYQMLDRLNADITAACALATARLASMAPKPEGESAGALVELPAAGLAESR